MNLLRPMASLTGALMARNGNAALAGWSMPPPAPVAPPLAPPPEPRQWTEGLQLAKKGQARPSLMMQESEPAAPFGSEARISFRVDAERQQRLRLAALRLGRSRQQLLTDALDAYLEANAALLKAVGS
jgi:hypothetical protein